METEIMTGIILKFLKQNNNYIEDEFPMKMRTFNFMRNEEYIANVIESPQPKPNIQNNLYNIVYNPPVRPQSNTSLNSILTQHSPAV